MKNSSAFRSIRDSMFRIISDVCWDLQTGAVGIKTKKETYTLKVSEDAENYELQKNPLQFFSLPIPAWALRVPLTSLQQGDVVVLENDKLAFFIAQGQKPSQIRVLKPEVGDVTTVDVGTNILLGQNDSILCVKNIMSTTANNGALADQLPMLLLFLERGSSEDEIGKYLAMMMIMGGTEGGNNMMLPLLLMNKGGLDTQSLMLMSMMNGGGVDAGGGLNNMLPLMLLGGGGGEDGGLDSKSLMLMMMMQQGGGGGMANMAPLFMMSGMFGGGEDVEDMTYNEDVGHWIDDAGNHYDYEGNHIDANDNRYWHEDGQED